MAVEQGYPVTLIHPQHQPAKPGVGTVAGVPEKFPEITVNSAAQEAQYRAKGYLRFREAPPAAVDYHEFPKTLRHPKYVPEQPSRIEARVEDGKIIGTYTVPMTPAIMPDLIVLNPEQEKQARDNGYKPAGEYNRKAIEAFVNKTPLVEDEVYDPQEYPKWVEVNGKKVLVEKDPNVKEEHTDDSYPRWEDGRLVEDPNLPPKIDPHEFPKWVHKDGIPSEDSQLATSPVEEAAIRSIWAKEKAAEKAEASAKKAA